MLVSCSPLIGSFDGALPTRGWREHGFVALTEWNRKREQGALHCASSVNAKGKEQTTETVLILARILKPSR